MRLLKGAAGVKVVEHFTLVGATTRLGALSEPFRARFNLKETL